MVLTEELKNSERIILAIPEIFASKTPCVVSISGKCEIDRVAWAIAVKVAAFIYRSTDSVLYSFVTSANLHLLQEQERRPQMPAKKATERWLLRDGGRSGP
jgi:hypothetical protein